MVGHSFFKGDERIDSHVGIGFVRHAEQKVRGIVKSHLAFVFNGSHGSETFDNTSVKVSHAGGALGIGSFASGSESSPYSGWALSTYTRCSEEPWSRAMVLAHFTQQICQLLRGDVGVRGAWPGGRGGSSRAVGSHSDAGWT